MNTPRIKKQNIKEYIQACKHRLKELEKEIIKMQDENETSGLLVYDITDSYLLEEHIKGQIAAATYILNNC